MLLFLIPFLLVSCETWKETELVSLESEFPVFELTDGAFISFVAGEQESWKEPGYAAYSGGVELTVYTYSDEINTNVPGVYYVYYVAENNVGLQSIARRVIAITNKSTVDNDLSGRYYTTRFSVEVEMKCKKVHNDGLYEVSEVLGYPGADMPGQFVDLGLGELVLISGEGDFGKYNTRKAAYTGSTLNFIVELLDEPNEGVEIDVTWIKED